MTDPTEITGVEDTGMIATDPPTEPEQPASMIVAKAADQWLHPLEPYGPAKALREMTRRIMLFDTGKIRMNPTEAAHLAQVSASAWLNPFTGEIWGWVTEYQSRGRTQRKLSIMPGRKGLIRHAKEQSIAEGDKFWPEYEPVVATQLRADYRLDTGDLGFICKLRSVREIEVWNQSLVAAGTAGLEPSDVKNLVGTRPFTFGLGILRAAEIATLDRRSDNRMTHTERAQKRAYMMSLKQKYVLPLAHAIGEIGQTVDDYLVEGEFTELEPPEPEELTAEQVKELADKAKETPVVDLEVEDRGSAEPEPEPESDRPLEVEGDTSAPRPYSPGLIRDRYKKATERFAVQVGAQVPADAHGRVLPHEHAVRAAILWQRQHQLLEYSLIEL